MAQWLYLAFIIGQKLRSSRENMKPTNLKGDARLCGCALADYSVAYADQNERDHAALVTAVRSGKVEVQME